MTWFRLPLFVWAHYATSLLQVLGTPVVAITLLLVTFERIFSIGIFNPSLGGDPVLMQHLFWFYSHPAVYIIVLPGFGVISDYSLFLKKTCFWIFLHRFFFAGHSHTGLLVWGHHMFVSGQSTYAGMVFSFLTFWLPRQH